MTGGVASRRLGMSYSVVLSDALRETWSDPPRSPSERSVSNTCIHKYLDHGATVGFKSKHIEKNPGVVDSGFISSEIWRWMSPESSCSMILGICPSITGNWHSFSSLRSLAIFTEESKGFFGIL